MGTRPADSNTDTMQCCNSARLHRVRLQETNTGAYFYRLEPALCPVIVAIDGPAGSGKSSTAQAVAQRLGYRYLNTGAMYRAVALAFQQAGADPTEAGAARVLPSLHLELTFTGGRMHVWLQGEDVTAHLDDPAVAMLASRVSTLAAVREKIVAEQRRIARSLEATEGGVLLEGRDIGTVVFPEAEVKVFLVADAEARARRRLAELKTAGRATTLETVLEEVNRRDQQDAERAISPLRRAEDAWLLDTTALRFEEQVNLVLQLVTERQRMKAV